MEDKIKILAVDDDELIHTALKNFGKKIPNVEITVATNGLNAIENVKNNKYDIIFMDLYMPGITGYEATTSIRKLENGKNLTIVALSGDDIPEEELKKYGFNSFAKKPMSKKIFEGHINSLKT